MIRLAARNLARNRWRSGLTVAGVAVAVAALVWSTVMLEAFLDLMVRSVAAVRVGDLRVESSAHAQDGSLFQAFPATEALIGRVRRAPGVRAVAPRLSAFGLLAREARSQPALVVGVAPAAEAAASEVARSVIAGTWLSSEGAGSADAREVVLGEDLARVLSVAVGDELVVMLPAADGSTGDDRLRVVGLARTGTSALDRGAAWMRLADVAGLVALDGQAHELMIRVARGVEPGAVAAGVRDALRGGEGPALVVRTWEELMPDFRQVVRLARVTVWVLFVIVYFVAVLGILNAQRMAALERRRELCVMMAVGVTPARLVGVIVLETALLLGLGVAAGALLGWGVSAWHAHAGLDLAALGLGSFSYGGAAIASRVYCEIRAPLIAGPPLTLLGLGSLCGLWPAIGSARLELMQALSGRA